MDAYDILNVLIDWFFLVLLGLGLFRGWASYPPFYWLLMGTAIVVMAYSIFRLRWHHEVDWAHVFLLNPDITSAALTMITFTIPLPIPFNTPLIGMVIMSVNQILGLIAFWIMPVQIGIDVGWSPGEED